MPACNRWHNGLFTSFWTTLLTYKSINSHLVELEKQGLLKRYAPSSAKKVVRALYFTKSVDDEISGAQSGVNFHRARAFVERVMERWVLGERIIVSMAGGGTGAVLARLDPPPPGVWEFRITEPRTQFRMFGQFVAKDVMVVTGIHNRSVLGDRYRSNNKRSVEWADAMHECAQSVRKLIDPCQPLLTDDPADYLSENFHVL